MDAKSRVRVLLVAVGVSLALLCPMAGSARAELVKVGLFGDSIAEGDHVPDAAKNAMPGALREALQRGGATLGGRGLIAAMPRRMRWSDGWQFLGFLFDPLAPYGASGYSAVTDDPAATATVEVQTRRVAVFFVRSRTGGTFSVTAGERSWTIDTAGPSSGAAHRWVTMPRGVKDLVIHGPTSGRLRFTGVLERRGPRHGERVVELSNLAHGARWAEQDFGPLQRQAIGALGLDVTILMYGGNEGLGIDRSGDTSIAGRYLRGLEARGRYARSHGGRCVIIPPGRAGITTRTRHLLERTAKVAAGDVGCLYAPVLDSLKPVDEWNRPSPYSDGIHPTARGYQISAAAVAPPVFTLIDKVTAAPHAAKKRRK
jgi:lysophospholipase L1-like esterase